MTQKDSPGERWKDVICLTAQPIDGAIAVPTTITGLGYFYAFPEVLCSV
jgi:hypothetical protein